MVGFLFRDSNLSAATKVSLPFFMSFWKVAASIDATLPYCRDWALITPIIDETIATMTQHYPRWAEPLITKQTVGKKAIKEFTLQLVEMPTISANMTAETYDWDFHILVAIP